MFGRVPAILIAAALAAGCGSAAVTPSPDRTASPVATPTLVPTPNPTAAPTLVPTPEPTPTPTPTPQPTPFAPVTASSCAPAVVPYASPVPPSSPSVSSKFVLHVPILEYHRVIWKSLARASNIGLVVPPNTFTSQLAIIKNAGWHTITLANLADDLEAGVSPPPKTFVITIDDGWADGYTHAWPILKADGFVATFFVITSRIGKPDFLSPDQIRALDQAGNEIAPHSVNHVRMTHLKAAALHNEVNSSAATIAAVTGHWPETFAYPAGATNRGAELAVQDCQGMKMAVIEDHSTWEQWSSRFAVPRLHVNPGNGAAAVLSWLQHPWRPGHPLP
jgi:peptidoglycan/xylan/chitin deacetylase (PgdA/CDA1 family)